MECSLTSFKDQLQWKYALFNKEHDEVKQKEHILCDYLKSFWKSIVALT